MGTRLFMCAVAVVVIAGCSKEPTSSPNELLSKGTLKGGSRSACADAAKISSCHNMLYFATQEDFDATYNCLDQANEAWLDAFEAQHSNLTDDQFNDLADAYGFVDEQALVDFETTLGFTSYRAVMAAAENAWLSSGANPATDPDDNNLFDDEILETLLSPEGA